MSAVSERESLARQSQGSGRRSLSCLTCGPTILWGPCKQLLRGLSTANAFRFQWDLLPGCEGLASARFSTRMRKFWHRAAVSGDKSTERVARASRGNRGVRAPVRTAKIGSQRRRRFEILSKLRGNRSVTREVLQIIGRSAWYARREPR